MFKDEHIHLIKIKEDGVNLKLISEDGVEALIFIRDDQLIIRSSYKVEETTIQCPEINIL